MSPKNYLHTQMPIFLVVNIYKFNLHEFCQTIILRAGFHASGEDANNHHHYYHQGGLTIAWTIFQACHGRDLMGEWPEAHVNKDS